MTSNQWRWGRLGDMTFGRRDDIEKEWLGLWPPIPSRLCGGTKHNSVHGLHATVS